MTTLAPTRVAFERILIPTDFSTISDNALEYAKRIAKLYHSKLLLAHVNEPINPVSPPEAVWIDEEEIRQHEVKQLEQCGERLRAQGLNAKTLLTAGTTHDELRSFVEKHQIDLIVMGTHGRKGLNRFLFGSDTEAVLRRVTCPVLVIGPFVTVAKNQLWPPKRILCATTLERDAARVAAYAFMLAHEYHAEFMLFNVENAARMSKEEEWLRFESAFRQNLPADIHPDKTMRTLLSDSRPGYKIVEVAKEQDADLIVIGARTASELSTHLLRGTAPQVFSEATCPVLTLHTEMTENSTQV